MHNFDPELLRTFLAFVDGGSLARAASIVGRSPSAVTAQMQRLKESVGEALLAPSGRGRSLTPAGEELAAHARRILAVHREAWLSLKGARADGRVSLGATQDFADSVLPELLADFARTHGRVRLDLRIGLTAELTRAYQDGAIDILLAMRQAPEPDEIGVLREPLLWLGASTGLVANQKELPLALLDPPCGFRTAATAALEMAEKPYRIAATSPSLSGLRAAVRGGIAVTVRTARWLGDGIGDISAVHGLPVLGYAEFSIRRHASSGEPAKDLARHLRRAGRGGSLRLTRLWPVPLCRSARPDRGMGIAGFLTGRGLAAERSGIHRDGPSPKKIARRYEPMFQVMVLICALNVAPSDCQSHNALDVINGPVVANEVMCGLHGQAQMAPTSMMKRDGSEYMKLQCLRLPQTDAGLRGLDEAVAARLAHPPVRQ